MIDVIIVREVRSGENTFHIGDKVRLTMLKGSAAPYDSYEGRIIRISEGQIGLCVKSDILTILSKDVAFIELIEQGVQA